jgi:hypothetical protein
MASELDDILTGLSVAYRDMSTLEPLLGLPNEAARRTALLTVNSLIGRMYEHVQGILHASVLEDHHHNGESIIINDGRSRLSAHISHKYHALTNLKTRTPMILFSREL